jgi:hypothetical protein
MNIFDDIFDEENGKNDIQDMSDKHDNISFLVN